MTIRSFTSIVAHKGRLKRASSTGLAWRQPENVVDFSSASNDGLRFSVSVLEVIGSADSWKLNAAFQLCKWNLTGAPNTSWAWYDAEDSQKTFLLPEGDFSTPASSVTNISPNPTLATGAEGWAQYIGTGATGSGSYETGVGYHDNGYRRVTWTSATTTPSGGQGGPSVPVTPGTPMTFALAVRESKSIRGSWVVRWNDGTYTYSPQVVVPANTWRFGGLHVIVPAGVISGQCVWLAAGTAGVDGAANRETGDWQDVDAHLVAEGHVPISFVEDTKETPEAHYVLASSSDVLPLHRSRVIKGFGKYAALRFWFETVNPSADFGLVLSISTE